MKNLIVNLLAKVTGLAGLLKSASKSKAYIGGGVLLATGGAKTLLGVASILAAVASVSDAAGLLALAQNAAQLPGLSEIRAGAQEFALGLVAVGLRHAVAKASAPPKDSAGQ